MDYGGRYISPSLLMASGPPQPEVLTPMHSEPVDRERILKSIGDYENATARRLQAQSSNNEVEVAGKEARHEALTSRPPALLRPGYALEADLLGKNEEELDFYVSCEQGRLDEARSFVERRLPSQAVLQYGLERASFGFQPEVAQYLLQDAGTRLHGNVFIILQDGVDAEISRLIALLQVFLDAGWHPNQGWMNPYRPDKEFCFDFPKIGRNKAIVEFLLSHGADPTLVGVTGNSTRSSVFRNAVRGWDVSNLKLLNANGVKETWCQLHEVVECMWERARRGSTDSTRRGPPTPFSKRRETAEHLLEHGSDVNQVVTFYVGHELRHLMDWQKSLARVPGTPMAPVFEDHTPLSLACQAQDWEFAELLLGKGADAEMLDGKALKKQWWVPGEIGPNDPDIVRGLVERAKKG